MSNRDRVNQTLDALVDEAYQRALDQGVAITNPDGWRAWKRKVYADTARREGPGYLRKHHQRLGLAHTRKIERSCEKCGGPIIGNAWHANDDTTRIYCSSSCAGVKTMSLHEWLEHHATPEQRANMERLIKRQEGAA